MTPAQFNNLADTLQAWAKKNNVAATDVAGSLVIMAAQNCVQYRVTRRDWRDRCAEAFEKARDSVQTDNPLLYDGGGRRIN